MFLDWYFQFLICVINFDFLFVTATGYESIITFIHFKAIAKTSLVELTHTNGKIEVSPDHLVFLADGRAVKASDVKHGDYLSSGLVLNVQHFICLNNKSKQ